MLELETRFLEFATEFNVLEITGLVFLMIIVSESAWDLLTRQRKEYKETAANFFIGAVGLLLEGVAGLVFIVGLLAVEYFAPISIPTTWWSLILAIIVADFTYYWMHRWEHEIRILWANHSVHHSSPEFNLSTALRISWVDSFVEWIFFLPMVLIGFDAVQTIVAVSVVIAYQTWIHTEKIGKLGWLDRVLNTPSVHRVHHASNGRFLDKNYGGILIIWDRLFGTYQAEDGVITYGVTKPLGTSNPFKIIFHEYGKILSDLRRGGTFRNAMGYLFGRPGWRPTRN